MRTHAAKPVGRVSGIRFLAMKDGVPELAFGRGAIGNQLVRFFEAGKIQPQSGHGGGRIGGAGEQMGGAFQLMVDLARGAAGRSERQRTASVAVQGQQTSYLGRVVRRIEIFHLAVTFLLYV